MKKKLLFAILLLGLLILTLWRFDSESLLHSITQIPLWLVILLAGLQIVSQLLVNTLWHRIAKLTDMSISFGRMLYINCQGAVVDSITPGVKFGGEVTRAVQISRLGNCTGEQAATVVAMQKLFSLSALLAIFLFAAGLLINGIPLLQNMYLQFSLYSIVLSLLALFLAVFLAPRYIREYFQKRRDPRFAWTYRVRSFLLTLLEQVDNVRKNPKRCVALLLLAVLIWLLYPIKLYLLAIQFVPSVSTVYIWSIAFLAYMVAMIPIFPGGLGGFEGTMSGLLVAVGLMISDAAVITALFRFITFWFVMVLSLAFITFYKARCARV